MACLDQNLGSNTPFVLCGITGRRFEILAEMSFGRSQLSSIVIEGNSRVSREHGLISLNGDRCYYSDLDSGNGSWIDGVKVPPNECYPLIHGAIINIASHHFVFFTSEDPEMYDHTIAIIGEGSLEKTLLGSDSFEDMSSAARARVLITKIETKLHYHVIEVIKERYGDEWWYQGVPENIRIRAAAMHEERRGRVAKEDCLMLLGLKAIILGNWSSFEGRLDPTSKGKRAFDKRFLELNDLRNRLSHPIRLKREPINEQDIRELQTWIQF